MDVFHRRLSNSGGGGSDRRASTSNGVTDGAEDSEKGSRSPYARIRTSFVAKFGNLLSSKEEAEASSGADRRQSRRKTAAAKAPEIDPTDMEELRNLVKEGKDADSRRGALLGLFKMSLKESVLEPMLREGAAEVLLTGAQEESKGGGARRAAMQAIKNLAAHPPNQPKLIEIAAGVLASIVTEEAPGSGPRQAALEALANLSANARYRGKLAATEKLITCLMDSAKSEPQGTQGREAALVILENLSQDSSPPADSSGKLAHKSVRNVVRSSANVQERVEEEEEDENESIDVQGLISACLETAAKEPKGSSARLVAVRTIKNFAAGKHRAKVAAAPGLYDTTLAAAKEDGPGSETRALVFELFSKLADDPKNREQLMKTMNLVDTIIAAVRDEAPGSPAREYAMFTVAGLCQEPKNRAVFMKGAAEGLVNVCVRASSQETPGSGGRAAALEVCAALALAPENQGVLFNSPGLLTLAVDSAYSEKSERVKQAGLDVMASLAAGSDSQRAAIYKMKHASEAVVKAVQDPQAESLHAAGIAALRSFCMSSEIRSALRKSTLDAVLFAAKTGRHGSRSRIEAVCCLEEGLFDRWNDARLSYEVIELCGEILKRELPASDVKHRACSLLTSACKHSLDKVVMQSGIGISLVGSVREFVDAENQSKLKKHESYSRASLRRTPVAKVQIGTSEQMAAECAMALKLLAVLARSGCIPDGALGACQGLLNLGKEPGGDETISDAVEGAALITGPKIDQDSLNLATYVAVQAITVNCPNSSVAKDVAGRLAKDAIARLLPLLDGSSEKGSIGFSDVLDVLFTLSSFENCVETEFKDAVMPLVHLICEKADSGETPIVQQRLCGTLLNCLFVPALADPLKVAEIRGTLEQVLIRIGNRGSEEHAFAAAGRLAQAVTIGLKIINTQATNPPSSGKEKRISVLSAADGLLLAHKVEDVVKRLKGFTVKIEEGEWFKDKHSWEKIALKNRKVHMDQLILEIKHAHAVIICASKGAEADPAIHMMAEFVHGLGVPTVVCTGIETTNNVCWGSWLESFKNKTSSIEANQLGTWTPFGSTKH